MADPCIYTANGGIEDSTNEEVTVQSCDNHVQVYIVEKFMNRNINTSISLGCQHD